jgi:periplasmic protein TonB
VEKTAAGAVSNTAINVRTSRAHEEAEMFERVEVASPSRPWATALAYLMNATLLTAAILLPMIRPDQLPDFKFREITPPYSAPPPVDVTTVAAQPVNTSASLDDRVFRAPSWIPHGYSNAPDRPVGPIGTLITGTANSDANMFTGLPIPTTPNPPPIAATAPPPRPQKIIVSHLDEGMLIRRVQPIYPNIAKTAHVQGSVELSALINTRGEIEGLQVISGSPLLVQAALDAVRQWRYRPYILNGSPIAVQTQVTVNFSLQ